MDEEPKKSKITYGRSIINYSVIKSKRRKTSQIVINENDVIIRTPYSKSDGEIKKIMQDKAQWIYKKQFAFRKQNDLTVNLNLNQFSITTSDTQFVPSPGCSIN